MNIELKIIDRVFVSSLLVGGLLMAVYVWQAILSRESTGYDLTTFLGGFWIAAAIVLGYWFWLIQSHHHLKFRVVFFWACAFRLIGVWGDPILEDDYFRYLLDACLFATYGSPYGIAPETLFAVNSLTPACEEMLTGVNNPHLATIYGPFLQYVFLLSYLVSPVNIDFLQFIVVLFDLTIVYMLGKMAPARSVMLYAWCPLVIKEFALTAHPDVIGVCLLLAAFVARSHHKNAIAIMMLSMAVCTKVFALAALPFFLYRQSIRYWLLLLVTVVALYLPFLLNQQHSDLEILIHFAKAWFFNAPVFNLLTEVINDQWARYLGLVIFLTWYGFYFRRYHTSSQTTKIPRMDWVYGVLLLLSPVLNPWYWVWILPFAVLWPSTWAWTVSVTIVLAYAIGLHLPASNLDDYQVAGVAQLIQISAVVIALLIDFRQGRLKILKTNQR